MGLLNLTTAAEVKQFTQLADLKVATDAQVQALIDRAEGLFVRLHPGGYDSSKLGYAEQMKAAANLTIERLWVLSKPAVRATSVGGFRSERIGTYEYERFPAGQDGGLIDAEVASILSYYAKKSGAVTVNRTVVFVEAPGILDDLGVARDQRLLDEEQALRRSGGCA